MADEQIPRRINQALDREEYERAVKLLRDRLSEDPYWAPGHRLLGDIYLRKLEKPVDALVEYRKLDRVKKELDPEEKFRLLLAYHLRSFEDRARRLLGEISSDSLPRKIRVLGEEISPRRRISKIKDEVEANLERNSSSYFKKYVRRGNEFLNAASYYRAQQAYDKALEFDTSPRVRLNRARCLVKRTQYPEAVDELQSLLKNEHVHEEARDLLRFIYERLGLPVTEIKEEVPGEEKGNTAGG